MDGLRTPEVDLRKLRGCSPSLKLNYNPGVFVGALYARGQVKLVVGLQLGTVREGGYNAGQAGTLRGDGGRQGLPGGGRGEGRRDRLTAGFRHKRPGGKRLLALRADLEEVLICLAVYQAASPFRRGVASAAFARRLTRRRKSLWLRVWRICWQLGHAKARAKLFGLVVNFLPQNLQGFVCMAEVYRPTAGMSKEKISVSPALPWRVP